MLFLLAATILCVLDKLSPEDDALIFMLLFSLLEMTMWGAILCSLL